MITWLATYLRLQTLAAYTYMHLVARYRLFYTSATAGPSSVFCGHDGRWRHSVTAQPDEKLYVSASESLAEIQAVSLSHIVPQPA